MGNGALEWYLRQMEERKAERRERLRRMNEYNRQQPRPTIVGLTPEEEKEYRACRQTLKEIVVARELKVKLPPRISKQDEADYRRALKPSAEILRAAGNGNVIAREIVRLATYRSPASGGYSADAKAGRPGFFSFLGPRSIFKEPR